jgi:hypothetical protein
MAFINVTERSNPPRKDSQIRSFDTNPWGDERFGSQIDGLLIEVRVVIVDVNEGHRFMSCWCARKFGAVCTGHYIQELSLSGIISQAVVIIDNPDRAKSVDCEALNLFVERGAFGFRRSPTMSRSSVLVIVVPGVSSPRSIL